MSIKSGADQTFQRYTAATRAAMIYCFEPIFGSLFGYLLNGEVMSWKMLLGALTIFSSIIVSEVYPVMNAWLFPMDSGHFKLMAE